MTQDLNTVVDQVLLDNLPDAAKAGVDKLLATGLTSAQVLSRLRGAAGGRTLSVLMIEAYLATKIGSACSNCQDGVVLTMIECCDICNRPGQQVPAGYLASRPLEDGRVLALMPLALGRSRITISVPGEAHYETGW